jgi:hypothetical protein
MIVILTGSPAHQDAAIFRPASFVNDAGEGAEDRAIICHPQKEGPLRYNHAVTLFYLCTLPE